MPPNCEIRFPKLKEHWQEEVGLIVMDFILSLGIIAFLIWFGHLTESWFYGFFG